MSTEKQLLDQAKPCPFCDSDKLTTTWWSGDDGEFTAIACTTCKAEAPADVWNNRASEQKTLINQLGGGDIPDHLLNI